MSEVERHIEECGVNDFVVGHYGAFDSMASRAVIEAKKRHPDVRLTMLLPYHPALKPVDIPLGFDGSYFPENQEKVPPRLAIIIIHKAAKKAFDELGVKKLPTIKSLQVEFSELLSTKKTAYADLKKVRDEVRELSVHKANYEELRDLEERGERKEKERGREKRSRSQSVGT